MKRRKMRLAAAFVVTVAAGCGETPEPVTPDNPPAVEPQPAIRKDADGTCKIELDGNPPRVETVPCPVEDTPPVATATSTATVTGAATAQPIATSTKLLPDAPKGWSVTKLPDGSCMAEGPDPCQHSGCNPPPPMDVACPPEPKDVPRTAPLKTPVRP